MTEALAGRRIVLTGCSRGVGLEAARLFLAEGAEILGLARDPERLATVHAELQAAHGARFDSLVVDVASADAAEQIGATVEARWGALDVAIHNAAVMLCHEPEISSEPEGLLERSLDINLLAPFRLTRALIPLLERGEDPQILNVSSGAGTHEGMVEPGIASYRLSKWALNGLTMLQAKELAGRVVVNAFDPGWVRTDLGGPNAPGTPDESARAMLETLLLPREVHGQLIKDGEVIPW